MEYRNTKQKGDEAELSVLLGLKKQGFTVSIPFGENAPYDLIAESTTGKVHRIQIRWASWKDGVLHLSLRIVSKNYTRTLDRTRIDAFIVWDGQDAYVIPVSTTENCNNRISLRKTSPKNGQKKGVRLASSFKNGYSLLL